MKPTPTIPAALAPIKVGGTGGPHLQIWWPYGSKNLAVDQSFEAFQKTHPTWSAEISYTNGFDKFLVAVASGTPPDVYMPSSDFLLLIAYKGIVKPLDAYIARDKVDMKQYYPAAVLGGSYKSKTYGLPQHMDVASLYQNDHLLQEVGLDPKQAPASWDDLAALNAHLVKKDGTALVRAGFVPTWGWPVDAPAWFQANGVPLVSADGTQVAFDTQAGLEALTWVQQHVQQLGGMQTIGAYQKTFKQGSGDALAHDALGIELMGVWDIAYAILKIAPSFALSQWSMPGGPSAGGKKFDYFIANFSVIPTGSKQADDAWEYVKYAASVEGQLFIQRVPGAWDIGGMPAAANDPQSLQAQPWRKRANELMGKATAYAYWPTPGSADVSAALGKPWSDMLTGKADPKTTLTQLKQAAQTVMDKYK